LIAGAIDFVIFICRENRFGQGGTMRRYVASVREVNGVDERILSSEVFADDGSGHAQPAAPISCIDELAEAGYDPAVAYAAGGVS
jgi:type II secretion system protein E